MTLIDRRRPPVAPRVRPRTTARASIGSFGRRLAPGYLRRVAWLAALLAVVLVSASRAGAEGVVGRLVNGSTGGGVPAGAEVTLHVLRGNAHSQSEERSTVADEQGTFWFDDVAVGNAVAHRIVAVYAGVTYSGAPARLMPEAPERRVELPVYETTDADPGVRATKTLLVLGAVDRERQEIVVMEVVTQLNPSDRTFVPSVSGPAGPMGLPRFGLPAGAIGLEPAMGTTPEQIIQVDRGFASTAPLPPGEGTVAYTYRLPYAAPQRVIEKTLSTGAGLLQGDSPENPRVLEASGGAG